MKTQHESPIQFSGYPLTVVDEVPKGLKNELTVVKSLAPAALATANELPANNPQNWDVDWFNSYE
jgi:hypothetical protein